jgi:hypothetical protein
MPFKDIKEHKVFGRKDKKQNTLIQLLVQVKQNNSNITQRELYYVALGYRANNK